MIKYHKDKELPSYTDETMTVSELIDHLSQFPGGIPVLATWEGIVVSIRPGKSVQVDIVGGGEVSAVVLDAEEW